MRCEYLHNKLAHIKRLISDFDQQQITVDHSCPKWKARLERIQRVQGENKTSLGGWAQRHQPAAFMASWSPEKPAVNISEVQNKEKWIIFLESKTFFFHEVLLEEIVLTRGVATVHSRQTGNGCGDYLLSLKAFSRSSSLIILKLWSIAFMFRLPGWLSTF